MDLEFADTKNRGQCGSQVLVNGFAAQCTFSSSRIVTVPAGLSYFDGRLILDENIPGITIPICKNHEIRLKAAFREVKGAAS